MHRDLASKMPLFLRFELVNSITTLVPTAMVSKGFPYTCIYIKNHLLRGGMTTISLTAILNTLCKAQSTVYSPFIQNEGLV